MEKVNYHTHTTGSDGKCDPETWVKLAIEKKFDIFAITDHHFFPEGFRDWGNDFNSDEHYSLLKSLQKKYSKDINLLVGVEFDWLEDYTEWICKESKKRDYDVTLISVHFLKIGEEYIPIDHSEETFLEMVEGIGGIKPLVKKYYSEFRNAIRSGCFEIVAHIDLIKMWNKDNKYFSDEEEWYKLEVSETLKLIKEMGMKIDLNTSGFRKVCEDQYPSLKILKEAKRLRIPIKISTDGHNPEEIDAGLERVGKLINLEEFE